MEKLMQLNRGKTETADVLSASIYYKELNIFMGISGPYKYQTSVSRWWSTPQFLVSAVYSTLRIIIVIKQMEGLLRIRLFGLWSKTVRDGDLTCQRHDDLAQCTKRRLSHKWGEQFYDQITGQMCKSALATKTDEQVMTVSQTLKTWSEETVLYCKMISAIALRSFFLWRRKLCDDLSQLDLNNEHIII